MKRRIRGSWLAAGGFGSLSCALLLSGTGMVLAQSDQGSPQSSVPPVHALERSGGAMNALSQGTASAQFLNVPMGKAIPGAISPQANIKSPVANDSSAAERGMKYFNQFNCVGCHAPNGGGGMGPSLSNAAFIFNSDPASLFLVIAHGAPKGMPAWGSVLPPEVIWDLVAYVQSISEPPKQEWGTTVSPAIDQPAIQQVPAEFKQTATPWQFVEPFGNGQAPSSSSSGAAGMPLPASSGSSKQ